MEIRGTQNVTHAVYVGRYKGGAGTWLWRFRCRDCSHYVEGCATRKAAVAAARLVHGASTPVEVTSGWPTDLGV